MQHRPLGNTGLRVSVLGLGAASLGNVYGEVDESTAIATVHRAHALGVDFFDASPYYGRTRAETVLGKALCSLPRHSYVLASKCGRDDDTQFDFSPAHLRASLEGSLQRLQTDHLDLLQLHDVEFGDLAAIFDHGLPVLHELQRS
ncbi:MAG TPA: aldo/keto reductase, partial [Planctomycetota bacterium]|nr:aldo/keto reductase [Planctomycetota bacterium]